MDRGAKFLTTVLLVALLYAHVSIPAADALRCYDCYSLKNFNCNDPFRKNSTASKDYPVGYVCVKVKGDLHNGDGYVVRREALEDKAFEEMKRSKTYPDVVMESCKTDLCNSAAVSAPAVAAVAASAIAAACLRLR